MSSGPAQRWRESMIPIRKPADGCDDSGQSLVETVLTLPLLLLVLLNALNFGYFFLLALNLAAAPRSGVEYSIMGSASTTGTSLPKTGPSSGSGSSLSVSFLTYEDMRGAVSDPTTNGALQVCSASKGLANVGTTTQKSQCDTFGTLPTGYTFPTPDADPELNKASTTPAFVLNRVDVVYQFTPLIPGTPFNILLLASPICSSTGGNVSCNFHRQAEMRALGP
jgi:hypothetical protein